MKQHQQPEPLVPCPVCGCLEPHSFELVSLSEGPGFAVRTFRCSCGVEAQVDLQAEPYWMQDIRIGYALWEGLYQLKPDTLEPIPGAAEKIDISPDGLIYTFHLRKDGKWSNGDPVTTADFMFAWKRMLELPGH